MIHIPGRSGSPPDGSAIAEKINKIDAIWIRHISGEKKRPALSNGSSIRRRQELNGRRAGAGTLREKLECGLKRQSILQIWERSPKD